MKMSSTVSISSPKQSHKCLGK